MEVRYTYVEDSTSHLGDNFRNGRPGKSVGARDFRDFQITCSQKEKWKKTIGILTMTVSPLPKTKYGIIYILYQFKLRAISLVYPISFSKVLSYFYEDTNVIYK